MPNPKTSSLFVSITTQNPIKLSQNHTNPVQMGDVSQDFNATQNYTTLTLIEETTTITRTFSETQKNALQELKRLIRDALDRYELGCYMQGELITMWGIPILGDERSDHVILRFLRARNFDPLDAFEMIKNTILWREGVCMESLLEQNLEDDDDIYQKVLFINGCDREGLPVWYLVLEEILKVPNICTNVEKQRKLLRWFIQFVEKNIRQLEFSFGDTNSFHLVLDLQNFSYYEYRNLYKVIYKFLELLNDNYPRFVAKQLWINAPWWYRTYCRVYSVVFDEWNSNKVFFAGSSKTIATLFKHISPGQVPVKYGGLNKEDSQFTSDDPISEITIKPASKHISEFLFAEECDVIWELRVIDWDVCYEAEFVPSTKGRYITNLSKLRKMAPTDESVISDNVRVVEPGKLVLTIHNTSSKKKKLLVRVRVMPFNLNAEDGPSLRGWLVLSDES